MLRGLDFRELGNCLIAFSIIICFLSSLFSLFSLLLLLSTVSSWRLILFLLDDVLCYFGLPRDSYESHQIYRRPTLWRGGNYWTLGWRLDVFPLSVFICFARIYPPRFVFLLYLFTVSKSLFFLHVLPLCYTGHMVITGGRQETILRLILALFILILYHKSMNRPVQRVGRGRKEDTKYWVEGSSYA